MLSDGVSPPSCCVAGCLSVRLQGHGRISGHRPELLLNNFNTRLGRRVGRMLGSLFHQDPQFRGRRVVTFHNQRDFIFFRWVCLGNTTAAGTGFLKAASCCVLVRVCRYRGAPVCRVCLAVLWLCVCLSF